MHDPRRGKDPEYPASGGRCRTGENVQYTDEDKRNDVLKVIQVVPGIYIFNMFGFVTK